MKCEFDIPEESTKIHGITNEISTNKGVEIEKIIDIFKEDLNNTDILLAHNVLFDYNILISELHRMNNNLLVNMLDNYVNDGCLFCSGHLTKYTLRLGKFKNKMPRLNELYYYCFGTHPKNQHDSRYDVLALVEIILGRLDNINCIKV